MKKYTAVGVMSGTSMDGLDLCMVTFTLTNGEWKFQILKAETVDYNETWKKKLSTAHQLPALDYVNLDFEYGRYIGSHIKRFVHKVNIPVDLVASHGHTVFHQPEKGFTHQIGNGAAIAAATRIHTICDFRSLDVAVGGQGAPLVPLGDELLFTEYPFCLNLGGFSNISYQYKKKRIAFDICPVNIILNEQAKHFGMDYDTHGSIGREGKQISGLLQNLNSLPYYDLKYPKSLGREWVAKNMKPLLDPFASQHQDILHTLYLHISDQISKVLNHGSKQRKKVLITGGGAHNHFLIELINQKTIHELVVPSNDLINFKESLIFAFLGVMRLRNQANCLASVTGAGFDSSSGAMHFIL